jgi:hypothetical protein
VDIYFTRGKDSEEAVLRRARQLRGPMQRFTSMVRFSEGVLSHSGGQTCVLEWLMMLPSQGLPCSAPRSVRAGGLCGPASLIVVKRPLKLPFPMQVELWQKRTLLFLHLAGCIPRLGVACASCWSSGLQTCRVVKIFGHVVSFNPLVFVGLPHQSVTGKDWQSDRETAQVMSPWHLNLLTYDDVGINLFQCLDCNRTHMDAR